MQSNVSLCILYFGLIMEGYRINIKTPDLLDHRKSPKYIYLLLLFFSGAYLLDNLVLGPVLGGTAGNYLLPAIMWGLIIVCLLWLPGTRQSGRLRLGRLLRWLSLACVVLGILGYMLQGFMGGFGKSPYDHSFLGILVNLLSLGTGLAALEISRSWILNRYFHRRPVLGIPLISLLFLLYSIPMNKFLTLNNGLSYTQFIGKDLLPGLGQNLLASYLAFLGGPVPAIIYRGGMLLVDRLSPILPMGSWAASTLIGILVPVLGMILVHQVYRDESGDKQSSRQGGINHQWLITSMAAIIVIWFCTGVFSYSPRVILTGSMVPVINIGDVVIVHKIPGTEAGLGDIIMFPMGDVKVTHRVVAVQKNTQGNFFLTKGDANSRPDQNLVSEKNVQGKVVMIVPKIGLLTMFIRGL